MPNEFWSGVAAFFKQLLGIASDAAAEGPGAHVITPVWEFPPEYWYDTSIETNVSLFPEWDELRTARPKDFAVAFSGGGTRSASASVGQLRGLAQNGWLKHVRYAASVSGGTWANAAFAFTQYSDEMFLGAPCEPDRLEWDGLQHTTAHSFNDAIANATLAPARIFAQVLTRVVGANNAGAQAFLEKYGRGVLDALGVGAAELSGAFDTMQTAEVQRREATFARFLSDALLADHLPDGLGQYFTWTAATEKALRDTNPDLAFPSGIARPNPERPFMVAGASMLIKIPGYPQVGGPVEYTPYYSGSRRQFEATLGGNYVWSAAYATHNPSRLTSGATLRGYVRAKTRAAGRPFSVADVMASSGAAPEFFLSGGSPDRFLGLANEAARYFPHFPSWAVRDTMPGPTRHNVPHADGGASDNLGLMNLLARQVRNILVFVNASEHYATSDDLRAICGLGTRGGPKEDHGFCQAFPEFRWDEIQKSFRECEANGEALIHCGAGWNVLPNAFFNLQQYEDLNICFVFNYPIRNWWTRLSRDVQAHVPSYPGQVPSSGDRLLIRFPWLNTAFESTHFMALAPAATQLLSHLSCWALTNDTSRTKIETFFSRVLVPPS
jgi:hypothetical protein